MYRILPVILLFLASGCATQIPLHEGKSQNNKTYEVDYLFEHGGARYTGFMIGAIMYTSPTVTVKR